MSYRIWIERHTELGIEREMLADVPEEKVQIVRDALRRTANTGDSLTVWVEEVPDYKCEGRATMIECETGYGKWFTVTHQVHTKTWTTVECPAHARHSETAGKQVELIGKH